MGNQVLLEPRTCRGCGETKPLEDFPLTRGKRFFRCKRCVHANSQKWAEEHREASQAIKQRYNNAHPDRVQESKQKHYSENREVVLARAQRFKDGNRERVRNNYRQQYAKDPTPFKIRAARRDEREKAAGGKFSRSDRFTLLERQGWKCAMCANSIDEHAHADHVIPVVHGGSSDISNRQMLCPTCNHRKQTRMPWEMAS